MKEAEQVKKAGDFHTLYDSCCGSGRSVRRLEKAGQAVEKSLKTIEETREKLCERQMMRERLHLRGMRLF